MLLFVKYLGKMQIVIKKQNVFCLKPVTLSSALALNLIFEQLDGD